MPALSATDTETLRAGTGQDGGISGAATDCNTEGRHRTGEGGGWGVSGTATDSGAAFILSLVSFLMSVF